MPTFAPNQIHANCFKLYIEGTELGTFASGLLLPGGYFAAAAQLVPPRAHLFAIRY